MEALVLIGLGVAIGALWRGPRDDDPEVVRAKLGARRIQRLAELVEGKQGTIRGKVEPTVAGHLVSPLTLRPCVYWRIVIDEVGAGDHVELGRHEDIVPFLVRTGDGVVRVEPDRAQVALHPHVVTRPGYAFAEYAQLIPTVRRPNHPSSMIRVKEYRCDIGALVTASGYVARETDPDAAANVSGYRSELPTRVVLSGSRKARLLLGD